MRGASAGMLGIWRTEKICIFLNFKIEMEIPKKLYKYEPFTDVTLRNLKRQSVHFSSPNGFNDPYDCSIIPEIQDLTVEQISTLKRYYLDEREIAEELRNEIEQMPNEAFAKMIQRVTVDVLSEQMKSFRKNNGITCLCETNDELLMWAHYGGKYKGFCLEFDTSFEPFKDAKKVNYLEIIPKVNPTPMIRDNDILQFLNLLYTKSRSWEYEKEWRILHTDAGTPYVYPSEALTAIYFGPDIEFDCFEIIALIILGQNPNVKFYFGKRSSKVFKVEFGEPQDYIPHIAAKKLGLIK